MKTNNNQQYFQDKVILITASSTGIGLGMAEKFGEHGAELIITSRNKKNIDEAVQLMKQKGYKAKGIVCHVGQKKDRENLYEMIKQQYKQIDCLILNAAVSTHFGDFLEMKEVQMDKMYEVNIKATILMAQEMLNQQLLRKDANILVLSSYAAYCPDQSLFFYSLTKTLLVQFTKLLQQYCFSYGFEGVRVNCIAPGIIKTKFSEMLWKQDEKAVIDNLQISRIGNVKDIANIALFLANNQQSEYIRGETIVAAGKAIPRF